MRFLWWAIVINLPSQLSFAVSFFLGTFILPCLPQELQEVFLHGWEHIYPQSPYITNILTQPRNIWCCLAAWLNCFLRLPNPRGQSFRLLLSFVHLLCGTVRLLTFTGPLQTSRAGQPMQVMRNKGTIYFFKTWHSIVKSKTFRHGLQQHKK